MSVNRYQNLVARVYNGNVTLDISNPMHPEDPFETLENFVSDYLWQETGAEFQFQFDLDDIENEDGEPDLELAVAVAEREMNEKVYVHIQIWEGYQPWIGHTDTGFLLFKQAVAFAVPKDLSVLSHPSFEVAFTDPSNTATPESIDAMQDEFVARLGGVDGATLWDRLPNHHVGMRTFMFQVV